MDYQTDYDAVVIGAGNAGLTAATTLQRKGVKTLLLERHNIPGGCATSFVRGEFEFEVALHQLSGLGTEDKPFVMRKVFHDLGVLDKLEFVTEKDMYRMVMPGEFDVTLPADWKGLRAYLIEHWPGEEENIVAWMKMTEALAIEAMMIAPKTLPIATVEILKKNCPKYVDYALRSCKDVLNEFFDDADIKAVLGAYWCYLGMPMSQLPFMDMAVMLYAYAAFKPCHIKGGSQAVSTALLESFLEAGGDIRFNCGAKKILTEDSMVKAVETEHGERFTCNIVVSNTSPIHTFHELLDMGAPVQAQEDMKSRRIGTSAFCLYVGLDCAPEDIGVTAASTFIIDDRDEEKAFNNMQGLTPPQHVMLTCYNHEDPSFAPPGKTILSLLCLQYAAPWQDLDEADYAETKYKLANELIDNAERIFPGIRDNIEEIEVGTPLTMMRYLNTPGGAIYGFEQNTQDGVLFRERLDAVKGLHFAGSWTGMGGFQPTYMAGASTGKHIAKKLQQDA